MKGNKAKQKLVLECDCGSGWVAVCAPMCLSAQLNPSLCDPMNGSPPGSSDHRILQARIWSGLSFPSPGDLLDPGITPLSHPLAGRLFTIDPRGGSGRRLGKMVVREEEVKEPNARLLERLSIKTSMSLRMIIDIRLDHKIVRSKD